VSRIVGVFEFAGTIESCPRLEDAPQRVQVKTGERRGNDERAPAVGYCVTWGTTLALNSTRERRDPRNSVIRVAPARLSTFLLLCAFLFRILEFRGLPSSVRLEPLNSSLLSSPSMDTLLLRARKPPNETAASEGR